MLKSLRLRLLVGMTVAISVLLVLFGMVIYATIRRSLLDEFDFSLEKMARTMAAAALVERGVIEVELVPELIPDFQRQEGRLYFQYWVEDGTMLDRSASLGRTDLPNFHGPDESPLLRWIVLPNGQSARAAGMRFRPAIEYARERPEGAIQTDEFPAVTVVVARETSELQDRLQNLLWLLIAAGSGTTLVGLMVSTWVVGRGLRPVRQLTADIAAVREDELAARIHVSGLPNEIEPVAARLNDLLGRLESAFARERSFTSDVAHELRTPLAGIRSTLEVTLSCERTLEEYQESLTDTLEISRRLQAMVENLLILARLDAGQSRFQRERVALAPLVEDCWQTISPLAHANHLSFENRISEDLVCQTDQQSMTTIIRNLLENSAEYAEQGGRVWVEASSCSGGIEFRVANTGCELSDEHIALVFERFWRADSSRRDTGLHCGLGLALVRRMITALGGQATARVRDGVFQVTLQCPSR